MEPHFGGPPMTGHPGWELGWLLPLLITALLVGVAIWAVLRITRMGVVHASGAVAAPVAPTDGALAAARMRYASGDLARDDYRRVVRDLGGHDPIPADEPPPTEPPAA